MKSTEDKDSQMRTALYNFFQKHANELRVLSEDNNLRNQKNLGDAAYELTQEQSDREWQEIIESASPVNFHRYLESIHIFGLANLLKTPIIILGDKLVYGSLQEQSENFVKSVQENDIIGIYLPFLFGDSYTPKHVRPLFIAIQTNHYAALIPEVQTQIYRVPIVDSSTKLLKVHFTEEASDYIRLNVIEQYFCVCKENHNFVFASWPNVIHDDIDDRLLDYTFSNATDKDYEEIENNMYTAEVTPHEISGCVCEETENGKCARDCINKSMFIECDPNSCKFGEQCENTVLQRGQPLQLKLYPTNKGTGVKAEHAIEKGTFFIEYVGEIIALPEFKSRLETVYSGKIHSYGMCLDKDTVIDATKHGNKSQYINHCCTPNCEVQKWSIKGFTRMFIFAKENIEPEEELTIDYKFVSFYDKPPIVCKCLSNVCRGSLSSK